MTTGDLVFLLGLFITASLGAFVAIASLNALTFPRLRSALGGPRRARLSVLVPARNEAAVIGATVRGLLAQTDVDCEVLVLDDASSDGTAARALAAAAGDPRLRVLAGQPLPPGWLGKNWACHQLAQAARGDWLLFTDADVHWEPGALAALQAAAEDTAADLFTVWPTQRTVTWGERLVVPLMALSVHAYLPALAVHHLPGRAFAAALGQGLLFRRDAYQRIGGHAAVRGDIIEDMALAGRVKDAGLRLRMAEAAGLSVCRMYLDWGQVRDGFAKNILAGHGRQPALLLLSTVFHWLVFVFPWLWLAAALLSGGLAAAAWPLALVLLGVGVRALTARVSGQRLRDAALLPLSVILMTLIAARALAWHYGGGPRWKGRTLAPAAE